MIQTWKEEVEHIECNRKKEAERTKRIHRDQAEMRRQELEPERRRLDIEGRESSDSLARGLSGSRDIDIQDVEIDAAFQRRRRHRFLPDQL